MFGSLFCNVVQWHEAAMAGTEVMISAATVVQLRTMQMATGAMAPAGSRADDRRKTVGLCQRQRKLPARAGFEPGLCGGDPRRLAPYQSATSANAKRLSGLDAQEA